MCSLACDRESKWAQCRDVSSASVYASAAREFPRNQRLVIFHATHEGTTDIASPAEF